MEKPSISTGPAAFWVDCGYDLDEIVRRVFIQRPDPVIHRKQFAAFM